MIYNDLLTQKVHINHFFSAEELPSEMTEYGLVDSPEAGAIVTDRKKVPCGVREDRHPIVQYRNDMENDSAYLRHKRLTDLVPK